MKNTLILLIFLTSITASAQTVFWTEDFETDGHGSRYTASSNGGFHDGTNDYFTRTDGSNINIESSSYSGYTNTWFWASEDTDDNGGDGNKEQVLQFTGINISGYTNLNFRGLFGVGNNFGPGSSFFDTGDYIKVTYTIDGGTETDGLWFSFENHGDNYNEPLALDSDFDNNADMIDGTNRLNTALQQFSIPIPSGNILSLSIKVAANAGSEEVAFDHFEILGDLTGTPVPAIVVTPVSLSNFNYFESSGPASSQSFFVSGTHLTGNLNITPPLHYEISADNINFQDTPINLTPVGGIASATLYTRLTAGLTSALYNDELISCSSAGAISQSLSCNGEVKIQVTLPNAWINEFHYDNIGTDDNEFVEVVIENAGSYALSDFTLNLYNGSGGVIYNTETINNFTVGDVVDNYSFYYFTFSSLQNGPDGLALDWQGNLIQFLSYEDSFTASEGPANYQSSTEINAKESNSKTPVAYSLHLRGTGLCYADFYWSDRLASPGQVNTYQFFGIPLPPVPLKGFYFVVMFFVLALTALCRFYKN